MSADTHFHSLRVVARDAVADDAVSLGLEVPPALAEAYAFEPGQHLTLRTVIAGQECRRSYSLCDRPGQPMLRIGVRRVEGGLFSNWVHERLCVGDVIDVMPPQGQFHLPLQPEAQRHVLAFATGSGITPVLSIVKSTLLAEPLTRVTLVYGNRSSGSVMFKEELEDLKDSYLGRFNLVWIMSRESQDIDLFNGRIDHDKVSRLLTHWIDPVGIDAVFICGPQDMMLATAQALQDKGVPASRIKTELFGTVLDDGRVRVPRQAVQGSSGHCTVEVVLDGTRRSFVMDKNTDNLVDAGIKAGLEMPFSCKGGVCSTCRALVVEGEVDMDINFALEDYEVARGFVLCCQSYPVTDALVIDFDREHAHS